MKLPTLISPLSALWRYSALTPVFLLLVSCTDALAPKSSAADSHSVPSVHGSLEPKVLPSPAARRAELSIVLSELRSSLPTEARHMLDSGSAFVIVGSSDSAQNRLIRRLQSLSQAEAAIERRANSLRFARANPALALLRFDPSLPPSAAARIERSSRSLTNTVLLQPDIKPEALAKVLDIVQDLRRRTGDFPSSDERVVVEREVPITSPRKWTRAANMLKKLREYSRRTELPIRLEHIE